MPLYINFLTKHAEFRFDAFPLFTGYLQKNISNLYAKKSGVLSSIFCTAFSIVANKIMLLLVIIYIIFHNHEEKTCFFH